MQAIALDDPLRPHADIVVEQTLQLARAELEELTELAAPRDGAIVRGACDDAPDELDGRARDRAALAQELLDGRERLLQPRRRQGTLLELLCRLAEDLLEARSAIGESRDRTAEERPEAAGQKLDTQHAAAAFEPADEAAVKTPATAELPASTTSCTEGCASTSLTAGTSRSQATVQRCSTKGARSSSGQYRP